MLLDEVAPRWHHRSRFTIAAGDDPLPAVVELTWGDVPLFRALMSVRSGGRLSTETRVWLTSADARRRFRPYWLVVAPFSGAIRVAWLRAARSRRR